MRYNVNYFGVARTPGADTYDVVAVRRLVDSDDPTRGRQLDQVPVVTFATFDEAEANMIRRNRELFGGDPDAEA